jgi:hypothetical protein
VTDELASAYLPEGVVVDDNTRHVAAQLALAWLHLTAPQRRLVLAYERTLDPRTAAKEAEIAGDPESMLGSDRVRLVLRLRSTLQTDTIPPSMIGRVLTRIALGIDEGTPHARIRAAVELARVQGAYVPPSSLLPKEPGETGEEALDQEAQDRIVQAAMASNGVSFADLLRSRVEAAGEEAAAAQEALANRMEVESATRQAAEQAQRDAKRPGRRHPARPVQGVNPVTGTVPVHLANTDALAEARAKMGKGHG